MKNKGRKILLVALGVGMLYSTNVMASTHVQYHFSLAASGQKFNIDRAARTDDTASGRYASDGWWNADTVN